MNAKTIMFQPAKLTEVSKPFQGLMKPARWLPGWGETMSCHPGKVKRHEAKPSVKLSGKLRLALFVLAGFCVMPACVLAQTLPTMPPTNYDQVISSNAHGTVASVSYYSSVVASNRTMEVYTPPGYSTNKTYPVIYAIHGISAWPDTIFASWCCGASTVSDNLLAAGKIGPVIIVAMDANNIDNHLELNNVIIPYIESHYSVYTDADHRGLYGYSLGGGTTFNEAFGYTSGLDTFRYISPTSAANFNHPSDADMFPNGGAVAKQKMKCLFISCGDADWDGFYPPNLATHNYCVSNSIPHYWLSVAGGGHDGGVWRPAMWNFLQLAYAAGISDPPVPRSAFSQIEAESFDTQRGGIQSETCGEGGQDVGYIQNGSHLVFNNVDFGSGAVSFDARVASATSGGNIELHLDSLTGTQVGTCAVSSTGGWQTWQTKSCLVGGATGKHRLYLKFTGGSGYLMNFNWWKFNATGSPGLGAAPLGVAATPASASQISLVWNASTNATSYNVKRSATSGGSYTNIASGLTATNYLDGGLPGSTINYYYYVVSAVVSGSETPNSAQAAASVPWTPQDVGSVGLEGSASLSNGVFTVSGSGADIWNATDAFRFVYMPVTGNCTILARVTSLQNVDQWSKAGVMIRASLEADAVNAYMAVTPSNGVTWQYRTTAGGTSSSANTTGLIVPHWVKLVRSGSTFIGYRSTDGVTWTIQGTTTIAMGTTAYVGLALTSHNNSSLCMATFDSVTAPGWAAPTPAPIGLVATGGNGRVVLTWIASVGATSYNVKRSTTNGGDYTTIASGVTATNYLDGGLASGTMYYYVVSAVVSGTETPDSVQAAVATISPTMGSLVHRYSFSEGGGTNVADSVGGPVWQGTLPNGGAFASGQLTLASAASQYAQLPVGIVSTLSSFTIIAWVKLNSTTNWSRLFDFGSGTTTNMFLTPQNGGDGLLRFAITTNGGGGEQQINCGSALSAGVWYQVAVTLNGNTGLLFLNGLPVGTNNAMTLNPAVLGSLANSYLGRSQYPDPYFNGVIDEFRIYNVGLSAAEIAATAALGSSQQLSTNCPAISPVATASNLSLSWPLECAGFTLQSRTNLMLGNWENVTSLSPQIIGGQWQITLPSSTNPDPKFYRLVK